MKTALCCLSLANTWVFKKSYGAGSCLTGPELPGSTQYSRTEKGAEARSLGVLESLLV